jgi:hypothetical protein
MRIGGGSSHCGLVIVVDGPVRAPAVRGWRARGLGRGGHCATMTAKARGRVRVNSIISYYYLVYINYTLIFSILNV